MRSVTLLVALLAAGALGAANRPAPTATAPAQSASPTQRLAQEHARVTLARMPLEKVFQHYRKLSGLTIRPDWNALQAAGITRKTPVTLKAYRLKFGKLLDLTLDSIALRNRPLGWYLSGDTVHVSTQMQVLMRNRPVGLVSAPAGRPRRRAGGLGEVNFPGLKLSDVIEFLRDVSGLNIHVNWRSLEAIGLGKDTPVTLKVRGVSVRRLLDLVTDHLSAGRDQLSSVHWVEDEGVVHIATGDALNRTTRTRTYDVSDLLMAIPNFEGPRINLNATAGDTNTSSSTTNNNRNDIFTEPGRQTNRTSTKQNPAASRREREEKLIKVIKNSIGEEMWRPTGPGSIRIFKGRLFITQTPLGFKLLQKSLVR